MNRRVKPLVLAGFRVLPLLGAGLLVFAQQSGPRLDAEMIAAAAGVKATTTPDGVVRLAWRGPTSP